MAVSRHEMPASASPNSSEDVDTYGTPATKISSFSPDKARESLVAPTAGIMRSKVPPPFVLEKNPFETVSAGQSVNQPPAIHSHDPFVSSSTLKAVFKDSKYGSKLSPVASSFTPAHYTKSVSAPFLQHEIHNTLPTPTAGAGGSSFRLREDIHKSHVSGGLSGGIAFNFGDMNKLRPAQVKPHGLLNVLGVVGEDVPGRAITDFGQNRRLFSNEQNISRTLSVYCTAHSVEDADIRQFFDVSPLKLSHDCCSC